jgi:hypothetical protein
MNETPWRAELDGGPGRRLKVAVAAQHSVG